MGFVKLVLIQISAEHQTSNPHGSPGEHEALRLLVGAGKVCVEEMEEEIFHTGAGRLA